MGNGDCVNIDLDYNSKTVQTSQVVASVRLLDQDHFTFLYRAHIFAQAKIMNAIYQNAVSRSLQ